MITSPTLIKKITYSYNELPQLANFIKQNLTKSTIFCLEGTLGTGKTTLIRALAKKLKIPENQLSSPSFSILNHYASSDTQVYHLDLYRIKNKAELYSLEIQERLVEASTQTNTYLFIEWWRILAEMLEMFQCSYYILHLEHTTEPHKRTLSIYYVT